jgi:hypothetical protein
MSVYNLLKICSYGTRFGYQPIILPLAFWTNNVLANEMRPNEAGVAD